MVTRTKTTIELGDELLVQAKRGAGVRRRSSCAA